MADIKLTPKAIEIHFPLQQKWATLHGDLDIPWSVVRGAEAGDHKFWRTLGWRAPGTALLPFILAGTYRRRGDRALVYWTRSQQPLILNLQGHKYDRVIIGVENAEAMAEQVNYALAGC